MIHICLALTDKSGRYSKFTGTTLASVFENTSSPVTAHILHDNTLTDDNRDKFLLLAKRYNQRVNLYNVEELCPNEVQFLREKTAGKIGSDYGIGAFYRLLILQTLPPSIDKIIYLDSDIIVNTDIDELWRLELDDKIFAAVPEILSEIEGVDGMKKNFPLCNNGVVNADNYFNSGVLLMNTALFRKQTEILRRGIELISQNILPCDYADQDLLNCCFSTRILRLPTKFNRFTRNARWDNETPQDKIYHYSGGNYGFGLGLDTKDLFNRLWLEYFAKTPWFDVQTIGRLFDEFRSSLEELKSQLINLSSNLSHKQRAFFVPQRNLQALKIFFEVRADEEIILAETPNAYANLLAAMKESRGQKVFFLMSQRSKRLREQLTRAGFRQNEDFFDGFEFLTTAHGIPLNSYPFALAM